MGNQNLRHILRITSQEGHCIEEVPVVSKASIISTQEAPFTLGSTEASPIKTVSPDLSLSPKWLEEGPVVIG